MSGQWYTAVVVGYGEIEGFGQVTAELYLYPLEAGFGDGAAMLVSAAMPRPGELDNPVMLADRHADIQARPNARIVSVMAYELAGFVESAGELRREVYNEDYSFVIGTVLLAAIQVDGDEVNWYEAGAHPALDPATLEFSGVRVRADGVLLDPDAYRTGRHSLHHENGVWVPRDGFGRVVLAPEPAELEISREVSTAVGTARDVLVSVSVAADGTVRARAVELAEAAAVGGLPDGTGGEEITSGEFDLLERMAGENLGWYRTRTTAHCVLAVSAFGAHRGSELMIDLLSARGVGEPTGPLQVSVSSAGVLRVDGLGGVSLPEPTATRTERARLDLVPSEREQPEPGARGANVPGLTGYGVAAPSVLPTSFGSPSDLQDLLR